MGMLRFALAMVVACAHAGIVALPGDTPVQAFYAISGFYMTLVLDKKYGASQRDLTLFYSNRFLRLFPVYALVLVLTLVLATVVPLAFIQAWRQAWPLDPGAVTFLIGTQIVLLGQDIVMFLAERSGSLYFAPDFHLVDMPAFRFMAVGQAWTLGVELALAPFIVRRRLGVILAFIAASIFVRLSLQLFFGFDGDPWSYRLFPSELALFLVGAIAYRAYRGDTNSMQRLVVVVATIVVALLLNRWNGLNRVLSVLGLGIILIALPYLARLSEGWHADRLLGELSYPIYIAHALVYSAIDAVLAASVTRDVIVAVAIVGFAAACYVLVDRPVDRWRQTRLLQSVRQRVATEPAATSSR
jgi:peptidoglycan/LPS O-acetylase OafA/YrhL